MPSGVYIKTEEHKRKISKALKKKTIQDEKIEGPKRLNKIEKFKIGLPIECKIHGSHLRWRMHTKNNVQCMPCTLLWQKNSRIRHPIKHLWKDARQHAKARSWEFEISIEDIIKIYELQKGFCCLSGDKFSIENRASLDRKDSMRGYVLENIQLVTIKVNRMKSNLSEEEFIGICKRVADYKKITIE